MGIASSQLAVACMVGPWKLPMWERLAVVGKARLSIRFHRNHFLHSTPGSYHRSEGRNPALWERLGHFESCRCYASGWSRGYWEIYKDQTKCVPPSLPNAILGTMWVHYASASRAFRLTTMFLVLTMFARYAGDGAASRHPACSVLHLDALCLNMKCGCVAVICVSSALYKFR